MQSDRRASANGHPVSSANGSGSVTKLESLQAKCRRQAVVIDTLREAVSTFHRGAKALKAENFELRAENVRLRDSRGSSARAAGRLAGGELVEVVIALDVRAPGAARDVVVECLERRVVASAVESAKLLMSELVTNSLRHSEGAMDEVLVSVELMDDCFRVGVQDSGSDAVIAARPADLDTGGGFGLNLVAMLSERWASSGSPTEALRSGRSCGARDAMRRRTRAQTVRDGSRSGRPEPWPSTVGSRGCVFSSIGSSAFLRPPAGSGCTRKRARMADVETGDQPRALRTLEEPSPPPSPGASRARNGGAVKRTSSKPAAAAPRHAQAQPETSTQEALRGVPEPAPYRIAGPEPSAATLASHELLWLEDPSRGMIAEPGDGSTGIAPWRRGLRG